MSDKQAMIEILARPFPPDVIETRPGGGGKEFQYIKGWAVIERLTEASPEWSTEVKWRQIQNMELFEWNRNSNKNEVVTRPVMMVEIDLHIPGLGTRTGLGVQIMRPGGEDIVKGAWTDALKVAASRFMVAHDLYKASAGDAPRGGYSASQGGGGGNQYQNQGGGGYTPDKPSEAQWGLFNKLANRNKIDKNQISQATVGKPFAELDKATISKVIKRLQDIQDGEEQWSPGGNVAQAARQEAQASSPPAVDEDGVIQETDDQVIARWGNTIAKATSGTQLDKIFESLSEYGLAGDQRLIDALEARNQELEGS